MKAPVVILALALLGGCYSHQTTLDAEPIIERVAGNQEKLASCVYLGLEKDWADGLRMVELKGANTTRIYQEIGAYNNIRSFDLALIQEAPDMVRAEVRSFAGNNAQGYKVLPVVQSCARAWTHGVGF